MYKNVGKPSGWINKGNLFLTASNLATIRLGISSASCSNKGIASKQLWQYCEYKNSRMFLSVNFKKLSTFEPTNVLTLLRSGCSFSERIYGSRSLFSNFLMNFVISPTLKLPSIRNSSSFKT